MASASLAHRIRQALIKSTKEAGEAFSRALRFDEAALLAPAAVTAPATPCDSDSGNETTRAMTVSSGSPVSFSAPLTSAKSSSKTKGRESLLNDASFIRAGLTSHDNTTVEGAFRNQNGIGVPGTRLEESEGWFITDLLTGKDEKDVFLASEGASCHGSMVMVSSVNSISFSEDEGKLQAGRRENNRYESDERAIPFLTVESLDAESMKIQPLASFSSVAEDIGEQISKPNISLDAQGQDDTIVAIEEGSSHLESERYYMIDAGNGWKSFPSLKTLVKFLSDTVQVFGAGTLRSTRFMLPIAESDEFLDELEKVAPYTFQDVIHAARAVTKPVIFAVAARFCLAQLTEAAVGWGLAAESATSAAAVAGEAAAATGATASFAGVCSTAFAVTSWVVVAGSLACAVVLYINELKHVRGKVFVCNTKEGGDAETGEALAWGYDEHCIIQWR